MKNYKNYNEDITIRELKPIDLYTNRIAQSFGNCECIYELKIENDILYYMPAYRINLDNSVSKIDDDSKYWRQASSKMTWCETIYTIKLNRDDKINKVVG